MRQQRSLNGHVIQALLLYLIITAVVEGENLWRGWVPFDERAIHLPNCLFSWRCLREGVLPLWNPYPFSGLPHLASHHAAALYPPVYLFFALFEPFRAFASMQAFHTFWMGLGTWALLRRGWRLRQGAALAGGVFFMLSGSVVAHEPHQPMIWAMAWTPWLLLLSRLTLERRPWAGPMLAVGLAFQIGAGYMQVCVMTWLVLGIEALALAWTRRRAGVGARRLAGLGGALVVGLGLMAVQFLATREILPMTFRGSIDFEAFTSHGYTLPRLLTLPFPLLYGAGFPSDWVREAYFGRWDQPEMIGSMAAPVWLGLLLLVLGPILARGRFRRLRPKLRLEVIFWSCVSVLSLSLVFGSASPLARLLYHAPVLNLFRIQTRWLLFFDLGLALLAAVGFHRLIIALESKRPTRLATVVTLGVAAVLAAVPLGWLWLLLTRPFGDSQINWDVFMIYQMQPGNSAIWMPLVFGLAALGVLALAGWRHGWWPVWVLCWIGLCTAEQAVLCRHVTAREARPPEWVNPPANEAVDRMLAWHGGRADEFRILSVTADDIRQSEETLPLYLAQMCGIYSVGGNWPLIPPDYGHLLRISNTGDTEDAPGLFARPGLLSMLNVRYLLFGGPMGADPGQTDGSDRPAPSILTEALDAERNPHLSERHRTRRGATIVENTKALPRAWLVNRLTPVGSPREVIDLLWEDQRPFDPKQEALVEVPPPAELPQSEGFSRGSVTVDRRAYDKLWLTVTAPDGPGFVVLSEMWYPHWWARVDGVLTPIYRTNGVLRGFYVPQGVSGVYLRYLPAGFKQGAVISLLFALAWGVWVVDVGRRVIQRRRQGMA